MFYNLFLAIMTFLTSVFGYYNALHIKDLGDAFIIFVLGTYFKEWLIDAPFFEQVRIDEDQDPKMAIIRVEGSPREYTINHKSRHSYVTLKLAWIIIRLTKKDKLIYKDLNTIRTITWVVIAILLFLSAILTGNEYLVK